MFGSLLFCKWTESTNGKPSDHCSVASRIAPKKIRSNYSWMARTRRIETVYLCDVCWASVVIPGDCYERVAHLEGPGVHDGLDGHRNRQTIAVSLVVPCGEQVILISAFVLPGQRRIKLILNHFISLSLFTFGWRKVALPVWMWLRP